MEKLTGTPQTSLYSALDASTMMVADAAVIVK